MKFQNRNPFVLMAYLKANKIPFEMKKTLFTTEIVSKYGTHKWLSNNSTVPKNELFFIAMLKKSMQGFDLSLIPDIDLNEIKYFHLPENNFEKKNCFEVDISGAYWFFAKEFIEPKIFERGLTVSKQTRLTALGSLAKTTTYITFNGREFIYGLTETEETKNIFFNSAKKTGDVIFNCFQLINKPVFFWVDAIFTESDGDLKYIHSILELNGLSYRTYFCEKIVSSELFIDVYSKEHEQEKCRGKPFRRFFKQKKNSNYFINKILNQKHEKEKKTNSI